MSDLNPEVKELLQKVQQLVLRRNHLLLLGRRCYLLRLRIWWNLMKLSRMEG